MIWIFSQSSDIQYSYTHNGDSYCLKLSLFDSFVNPALQIWGFTKRSDNSDKPYIPHPYTYTYLFTYPLHAPEDAWGRATKDATYDGCWQQPEPTYTYDRSYFFLN